MRHCARCLALRHSDDLAARSASAHWPNVGFAADAMRASRLAVIGLTPDATNLRASAALSRAWASVTAAPPTPISLGFPPEVNLKIHFRAPVRDTTR
jgi:hypothetical protein